MNTTAAAIHQYHSVKTNSQPQRGYVGWSALGKPCERALWYSFHWCTDIAFEGRIARLFDTGHREEDRVLDELRAINCTVWDRDPATGGQIAVDPLCNGHLRGHVDAVVKGLPECPNEAVLVDIKTIKSKKFDRLVEWGIDLEYPQYCTQAQGYMGLLELQRAAYIFVDKDTDRITTQWIDFDQAAFDRAVAKAQRVIASDAPPARMVEDRDCFQCRYCDHSALCYGEVAPQVNCRTCVSSSPAEGGQWHCNYHEGHIPEEVQRKGCDDHLFIAPTLGFAELCDSGGRWAGYRHRTTGVEFYNVTAKDKGDGRYTSDEIAANHSMLGDPGVDQLRNRFDGTITG